MRALCKRQDSIPRGMLPANVLGSNVATLEYASSYGGVLPLRRRSPFRRRSVDAGIEGHQAGKGALQSRAAVLVRGAFPAAARFIAWNLEHVNTR